MNSFLLTFLLLSPFLGIFLYNSPERNATCTYVMPLSSSDCCSSKPPFSPLLRLADIFQIYVMLYLVYIALRRGQIEATINGFIIGLLQDVITTQFFGLAALSKTIAGFVAGYFFNENTTRTDSWFIPICVAGCTLFRCP